MVVVVVAVVVVVELTAAVVIAAATSVIIIARVVAQVRGHEVKSLRTDIHQWGVEVQCVLPT